MFADRQQGRPTVSVPVRFDNLLKKTPSNPFTRCSGGGSPPPPPPTRNGKVLRVEIPDPLFLAPSYRCCWLVGTLLLADTHIPLLHIHRETVMSEKFASKDAKGVVGHSPGGKT